MNSGRFANSQQHQQHQQTAAQAAAPPLSPFPMNQRRTGRLRLVRPAVGGTTEIADRNGGSDSSRTPAGGSNGEKIAAQATNGGRQLHRSGLDEHGGAAGAVSGEAPHTYSSSSSSSCSPSLLRSLITPPPHFNKQAVSPYLADNDTNTGQTAATARDSMTDSTIAKSSSDSMYTQVPEGASTSAADLGTARTAALGSGLAKSFGQHQQPNSAARGKLFSDGAAHKNNNNNNRHSPATVTRTGDSNWRHQRQQQQHQNTAGAIEPTAAAAAVARSESLQSTPTMEHHSSVASSGDSVTETGAVSSTAMLGNGNGNADGWTASRHGNVAGDSSDQQYIEPAATAGGEQHIGTMLDGDTGSSRHRMAGDMRRMAQTASPPRQPRPLPSLQFAESEHGVSLRESRSVPASATAARFPSHGERMSDIDYVELLDSYYDYLPFDESNHSMAAGEGHGSSSSSSPQHNAQRQSNKAALQLHKDRINSWRASRGLLTSDSGNIPAGRGGTSSYYGKADTDNSYSQTLENALFYSHAIQQINDGSDEAAPVVDGPSAVTVPRERPDRQTLQQRRGRSVVASREVLGSAMAGATASTFIPIPSAQLTAVTDTPVHELPPLPPIPPQHASIPIPSRSAPVSRGPSVSAKSNGDDSSIGVSSGRVAFTSEPPADNAPDSPTDGQAMREVQQSGSTAEEKEDDDGVKQRGSRRTSRISDAFAQLTVRKHGSRRSSMAEPRMSAEISDNPRRASVHSTVYSAQTQARRLSMTSQFSSAVRQGGGHHIHIPPSHESAAHQHHSASQQSRQIATRLLMRAGLSRIALRVAGKAPPQSSSSSSSLSANRPAAFGSSDALGGRPEFGASNVDLDPNGLQQLKAERRKQIKHVDADGFIEFEGDDALDPEHAQHYSAWLASQSGRGRALRHQRSLPHGLGSSSGASSSAAEAKWAALLRTLDASTMRGSRKVKQLVQAGLPMPQRADFYYLLAGAPRLELPNRYALLLAQGDLPIYDVIERDVPRCYPDHVLFADADGAGQRQLRRILRAYAHHNPAVGYCQGMGRLVGLFLIVGMSEERAFWALVATIHNFIPRYYEPDLAGLRIHTAVFEALLRERRPQLFDHLAAQGCDALMYATPWFMTIFTLSLPWQSALRVWDWFLYRGPKALFRIALAIMDLASGYLLDACPTIAEQLGFLLHIPPSLVDADSLINAAIAVKVSERHIERLTRSATAAVAAPKH